MAQSMLWRRTTPWKSGEDGSNEQGYVPCENDPEPHCGIGYSHELLWQRDSGDSDIARKLARQFIVDCSDEPMNVAGSYPEQVRVDGLSAKWKG